MFHASHSHMVSIAETIRRVPVPMPPITCVLLAQYAVLLSLTCIFYYLIHLPSHVEQVIRTPVDQENRAHVVVPSAAAPPPSPNVKENMLPSAHRKAASPSKTSGAKYPLANTSLGVRQFLRRGQRRRRRGSTSCVALSAWDDSHFSADQDWVLVANGRVKEPATLWRWIADGSAGHLRNKGNGGHLNSRPGGFVRGHGSDQRRPAPQASSSKLIRAEVPFRQYAVAETRSCTWAVAYHSLRFHSTGKFVHVLEDGTLSATMTSCSDDLSCLFSFEGARAGGGWQVVRSVLTGGLLRMVGNAHPAFTGWVGVQGPPARAKNESYLAEQVRPVPCVRRGAAWCGVVRRGAAWCAVRCRTPVLFAAVRCRALPCAAMRSLHCHISRACLDGPW